MSHLENCHSLNSSHIYVDKNNVLLGKFIGSIPSCNLTQEDFIVNKENIFFPPLKENELISTKSAIDDFTEVQKCSTRIRQNPITDSHSVVELSANVSRIHSQTQYFEQTNNNMEITLHAMPPLQPLGILKNKFTDQSHYNELLHLSTEPTYTNKKKFSEVKDSMNFTLVMKHGLQRKKDLKQELNKSEDAMMEMTGNISKYCDQKRDDMNYTQTIFYPSFDGNMEITSAIDDMESTQKTIIYPLSDGDMEITSTIHNMDSTQKTIMYPPSEENMEITSALPTETFFYGKDNSMELMEFLPGIQKSSVDVNDGVSLFSKAKQLFMASNQEKNVESKNQTIVFQQADADLDMTSVLPSKNVALLLTSNAESKHNSEMSFYLKEKTSNKDHSESVMDLTSPVDKTIVSSDYMQKRVDKLREKYQNYVPMQNITLDNSSKTRNFSNSECDMELTTVTHCTNISEEAFSSQAKRNIKKGDAADTNSITQNKQFQNTSENVNSCIEKDHMESKEYIKERSRIFQRSEGDMDLTTPLSCVNLFDIQFQSLSYRRNKQRLTANKFQHSERNMEFIAENEKNSTSKTVLLPMRKDSKRRTQIFQSHEGDMELTTELSDLEKNKKSSGRTEDSIQINHDENASISELTCTASYSFISNKARVK